MREIKFKAKRLDNGEWVKGYFYEENDNTYIIENRQKESMLNRNVTHQVDSKTVCQFTGLTDCEGNEVWEGDIIDFDICLCSVVWVDSVCAFCLKNITLEATGTTPLEVMLDYYNNYRVLGSIYDSKWKERKNIKDKWRMEKKVLTVHLAEPWYSMIVSAEKMEEYRVIKPYWIKRLTTNCEVPYDVAAETHCGEVLYRPYTHILFVKGYPKGNKPSVEKEIESITIGKPQKGLCPDKWLDTEFFIIKFK